MSSIRETAQVKRARLLERAAKKRQAMLDELNVVVTRCNCAWPIETMRNGHGHDKDCPAGKDLAVRFEDEDD